MNEDDDVPTTLRVKMSTKAKLDALRGPGNPENKSYDDVIQGLMRGKK